MGFPLLGRTLGVKREQSPFRNDQIGQGKQGEELRCVLGQSLMAVISVSEQVLDVVKRMLDFGPNTRLEFLDPLIQPAQFGIRQGLTFAGPHGDKPLYLAALVLYPFLDALVAGVPKGRGLFTMQQLLGLGDVIDVGRCGHQGMHKSGVRINANVGLHAEVPLVPLLGLMHLGIPPFALILGRARGSNDGGVHHRTALSSRPLSARLALMTAKMPSVSLCSSSKRRNLSKVVASGGPSRDRSIPTKPRIAWLS